MTTPILFAPSHRGASMAAGVRLTTRGRAVLATAVSLLLCGIALATVLVPAVLARPVAHGGAVDAGADAAAVLQAVPGAVLASDGRAFAYTVDRGDTLWDLAVALSPGVDPRPMVDRIRQLNAMTGSSLTVGERLWLPVTQE